MPQSGNLVKQWKAMKIPALMAGYISPLSGLQAWKTYDGKIGRALNCILEIGNSISSPKVPKSQAFTTKYRAVYGTDIQSGHGVSPAYESVYILAEAIKRAGSLHPNAIAIQLERSNRRGVIGRVKFNPEHQVIYGIDPKETAVGAVIQWTEDGKRRIVFPDSLANEKIHLPPWMKSMK
jgi:branched-chain amino acid transport system substrate-binding protein